MNLQSIKAKKRDGGFTIVELLIVVVIIGILAAIVIVAYNGITNRAKAAKAHSLASTVVKKLEAYNAEVTGYPAALSTLTSSSNSSKSYYIPSSEVASTANSTTKPTSSNGETTIQYAPCGSSPYTGVQVSYYDFEAGGTATKTLTAGSC